MTDHATTTEAAATRPFPEEVRAALAGDSYDGIRAPSVIGSARLRVLTEAARQWLEFTDAAKPVCDELEGKGP